MAHRICVRDIAEAFGLDAQALIGKSRHRPLSRARQAGYWVFRRRFPSLSWPQIAKIFGRGDHSTLIYGERRCEAFRAADADYRARTDALARGKAPYGPPVPIGTDGAPAECPVVIIPDMLVSEEEEGNERDVLEERANDRMMREGSRRLANALRREWMAA